jgi:hypothetical protein
MSLLEDHFSHVRTTLLSMYEESRSASHTVVTGTLREGFIRAALQGHLPTTSAWSSGQLVGYAPNNNRSGQLDIIIHSGELPQIHIHDGYVRLVPSDAAVGVVEVKSDLTTGNHVALGGKATNVLTTALNSLVSAKRIDRRVGPANVALAPVPVHIVAFHCGQEATKLFTSISDYMNLNALNRNDFWPESVVVLRGAKKKHPNGYGLFRTTPHVTLPNTATNMPFPGAVQGPAIHLVNGPDAFATFVALLSNSCGAFPVAQFRMERYVY